MINKKSINLENMIKVDPDLTLMLENMQKQ